MKEMFECEEEYWNCDTQTADGNQPGSGKREGASCESEIPERDCPEDPMAWVGDYIGHVNEGDKEQEHDAQQRGGKMHIPVHNETDGRTQQGEAEEIGPEQVERHPGGDELHDEARADKMLCSEQG